MLAIKQPTLAELTNRLLKSVSGEGFASEGDVEPHEVLSAFRTDVRTAYSDAVLAPKLLGAKNLPVTLPPEWSSFVNRSSASPAIPMAAGSYPQRVRELNVLLDAYELTDLQPRKSEPTSGFQTLRTWIDKNRKNAETKQLAEGLARELGDSVNSVDANEKAAGLWQSGKCKDALSVWQTLPESPVVSFNLGMALLFTGSSDEAMPHLREAVASLPDNSGWSHLAGLYLAVAEMR